MDPTLCLDPELLTRFEAGLDTRRPERSAVPARIIGYGEISTIFTIDDRPGVAFKRMPLFAGIGEAEAYARKYYRYCRLVTEAGIRLPDHGTAVIAVPGKPVTLYIGQRQFPEECLAHRLVQSFSPQKAAALLTHISDAVHRVGQYNRNNSDREIAIDGQLSNWVWLDAPDDGRLFFIDTSTPLYRLGGVEQLDAELLLQSAPAYLRWILRLFFLEDVLNRYYDTRKVCIDLAANLIKEQRPDLIPATLQCINRRLDFPEGPISKREVAAYYREDKMIWTLYLTFRKIDRWIQTALLRQTYPFILPGRIRR